MQFAFEWIRDINLSRI